jgi:hypothetical protein
VNGAHRAVGPGRGSFRPEAARAVAPASGHSLGEGPRFVPE